PLLFKTARTCPLPLSIVFENPDSRITLLPDCCGAASQRRATPDSEVVSIDWPFGLKYEPLKFSKRIKRSADSPANSVRRYLMLRVLQPEKLMSRVEAIVLL